MLYYNIHREPITNIAILSELQIVQLCEINQSDLMLYIEIATSYRKLGNWVMFTVNPLHYAD